MHDTLEKLLARCQDGDRQAMATLMQRYWLHARDQAAAILHDEQLAEDAAQETMVVVLQRLTELREPGAFAGWLRQVARSQAHRILRRTARNCPPSAAAERSDGVQPDEPPQREELQSLVRETIARLPKHVREPVELFYLDELAQEMIASRLHLPEGTIKSRLHDARRRMRDMLLGYITDGTIPAGLKPPDETLGL